MIKIVQAGQVGKTALLFDMHRLRNRIFKEQLGWDVTVDADGLEVDQFDIPEALYLLSTIQDRVVGAWRLLPSTGPTMIRDLWPEFTTSLPFPAQPDVWEVSRFAVSPIETDRAAAHAQCTSIIAEMFCGLTEFCLRTGIKEVFTLYDDRIAKVIKRIDCEPYALSDRSLVGGSPACVGAFKTDHAMLERLQLRTGRTTPVLQDDALPFDLQTMAAALANA